MFGFMRSCYRSGIYQKIYCNTCRHLKTNYGMSILPALSYEAAFLHALAYDAGLLGDIADHPCKCKRLFGPRTLKKEDMAGIETRVGEFSSALNILLLAIKLEDDIFDDNSRTAKLIRWWNSSKIRRSREFFSSIDPEFGKRIEEIIDRHRQMENANHPIALDEYIRPTGEAFSYVFSLFSKYLEGAVDEDFLRTAGYRIGSAIIAGDCAFDWERDAERGSYNPVTSISEAAEAYQLSQEFLLDLRNQCIRQFGDECLSGFIAHGTHDNLYYIAKSDRKNRFLDYLKQWTEECVAPKTADTRATLSTVITPAIMLLGEQEHIVFANSDIGCAQAPGLCCFLLCLGPPLLQIALYLIYGVCGCGLVSGAACCESGEYHVIEQDPRKNRVYIRRKNDCCCNGDVC